MLLVSYYPRLAIGLSPGRTRGQVALTAQRVAKNIQRDLVLQYGHLSSTHLGVKGKTGLFMSR